MKSILAEEGNISKKWSLSWINYSQIIPILRKFSPFSKESMKVLKVKTVLNFDLFDTCASVDTLFEKSGNIKKNIKSKNIIFQRLPFFEKVKSV